MSDTEENLLIKFKRTCRDAGIRFTNQRFVIYRELALSTDHPTAEALYQRLHEAFPSMSLDTVYRTLATFEQHGFAKKVDTVHSLARFEVARYQHHHLICRTCSKIIDFIWQEVDTAPLPENIDDWGRIDTRNVVIYGVCKDCLNE